MDNKLLTIIETSNISEGDKKMWNIILDDLPANFSNDIRVYLESNPDGVSQVTENLKTKIEMIQNNDAAAFEDLLKNEVKSI